jgi:uncharacterized protein YcsI (UPF0317 family)
MEKKKKKHWSKAWYTDLVVFIIGIALAFSYPSNSDVYSNHIPSGNDSLSFYALVNVLEKYGGKELVMCVIFGLSIIPLISAIRKLIRSRKNI